MNNHSYHLLEQKSDSKSSQSNINVKGSRSFMLALFVGLSLGFAVAYLMMSIISWNSYGQYSNFAAGNYHRLHHTMDDLAGPEVPVSQHKSSEIFHERKFLSFVIFFFRNLQYFNINS